MHVQKSSVLKAVGIESPITQAKMLEFQRVRYDKVRDAGADKIVLDLMIHEAVGGDCPYCKKPWRKVVVANAVAHYEYYDPDCECYQRCDVCGMSLHGVTFPNREVKKYKCPRCGHTEPQRWRLTCAVCGQSGENHEGRPYRFVCSECKSKSRKSKKEAYDING
jgi:hypothetical protein